MAPAAIPVSNFTYVPTEGTFVVVFQDLSSNGPTAWQWDFGDGTSSSLQNPSKDFTRDGFFTVTLSVSNTGGTTSITLPVGVRAAGPVLSQSIYTLVNQYIPPNVVYDVAELAGLIQKQQLFIHPLVNHIIPSANIFNELYYEPLENSLVASMVAYDILIQQGNSSIIAANNGGSSSSRAIKQIVTGPTEVQWYGENDTAGSSSSSLKSGGAIDSVSRSMCSLAKRLNIHIPVICDKFKVVIGPLIGQIPKTNTAGCCGGNGNQNISSQG